jgi:hypothetical protein
MMPYLLFSNLDDTFRFFGNLDDTLCIYDVQVIKV